MIASIPSIRVAALFLGAGALAALHASSSRAVICTPDPVPAATLLLPYFELDARDLAKEKPKRETPVFWVTNTDATATRARVTLWTDLSVPTLAFDLVLTGFDVEEVDLRQVFRGTLPGDLAIRCDDGLQTTRELSAEQVERLRLAHSGQPLPGEPGACAAVDHGDTKLRGYVTVDDADECFGNSAVFPSDPGYFGPGGIATNDNVLIGQSLVWSRKRKIAESARLVAIEADESAFGSGDATFYGRYVAYSGADAREPLPSAWGLRYLNDASAKQATELLVWRNAEAVQAPFACDRLGEAGWYPLSQADLVWFDDAEVAASSEAPAFPAEANRVALGGAALPIPDPRGWLFLNLDLLGFPRQSWVTARLRQGPASARGLVEAAALETSCGPAATSAFPIPPPVFPLAPGSTPRRGAAGAPSIP